MNTQVLVHQAALLNREGIAALSCGYGEKAHACFKNVLEIMGYITQATDLVDSDMTSVEACRMMESLSPVAIPNMQSERFFVYNHALLFTAHSSSNSNNSSATAAPQSSSYSHLDVTLFSAAAIFNMALTYNQRALMTLSHRSSSSSSSSSPHNMLRVAARMYDQCLQIVGSLPTNTAANARNCSRRAADVSILQMIVWNNRAHLSYELDDFAAAQVALEHVRTLSQWISSTGMLLSPSSSSSSSSVSILPEDDFDEIALNVLVTTLSPSTAPCA